MGYMKPQLSNWEKAAFVVAILRALSNGFLATLTGPFRGPSGSAKYANHVKLAILRTFLSQTTVRQLQAISPTVSEAYTDLAQKKNFPPHRTTCADGTKAFWIGPPSAEKVILWFHGGGYALPPDAGHLTFFRSILSAASGKTSILMPEYSLSPHGTYPQQLREGVELVRHLCTDLRRKPQDVTIAGDSAGANLAMGVMSHMLHPHPEIPPLELDQSLDAAILLAPWASFRTDWPSNRYNAKKDYVSAQLGDKWSASFLGGKEKDGYNEPLSAPKGWFEGLSGVVGEVLVVGGGDEVLLDCIKELAKVLKDVHPKTRTVIADGEWHDMPITSVLGGGGEQAEAVKAFVNSRL